jgi:K+-transporting ATPase A subunit
MSQAVQYIVFLAIVTALVRPLGGYIERVFSLRPTALDRVCVPLERLIYRASRINPTSLSSREGSSPGAGQRMNGEMMCE